ncbi:hypothetical protein MHU86_25453 [Fragilaria crotonensis]|nr:hypothetical protein MHU86_25453 [Fragilaria crotonensis]
MNPIALPPMVCEGAFEGRCSIGPDAQHMALIQPTDIMLGRGPAFYNNPGNRLLRKVVKEHAIYYKNTTLRGYKSALVKLIIALLQAKGCRFLHQSLDGSWVEAPSKIIEKKVGHGLRDARLAADKNGGNGKVLWKNFRPAITTQMSADQVTTVVTGEVNTTMDVRSEKPDNTTVMTMGMDLPRDATAVKLLHESLTPLVPSNSVSDIHEGSDDSEMSLFDRKVEEVFEHWDSVGDVKSIMEPWHALPVSFCNSETEGRLEKSEQGRDDTSVSPGDGAIDDNNVEDAVGVALNKCADLFYDDSVGDFPVDEPPQSLWFPLYDGQSICRWFGSLP